MGLTKYTKMDAMRKTYLRVLNDLLNDNNINSDMLLTVSKHGFNSYINAGILSKEYDDELKSMASLQLEILRTKEAEKRIRAKNSIFTIDDARAFI